MEYSIDLQIIPGKLCPPTKNPPPQKKKPQQYKKTKFLKSRLTVTVVTMIDGSLNIDVSFVFCFAMDIHYQFSVYHNFSERSS